MTYIHEAIDTSDDEAHYSYGVWMTLAEAIAAVEKVGEPATMAWPANEEDESCTVQIIRRTIGWSTWGPCVVKFEWSNEPDEDGEYHWRRTRTDYPEGTWTL